MSSFTDRLIFAAQYAGVEKTTQAAIADSLGISRQLVNRWFRRGGEPNAEMLVHISSVYRVSSRWLKTGEGDMPLEADEDRLPEEKDLLRGYRAAPPSGKKVIISFVRAFVRAVRKSVVAVSLAIPPLLSPNPSEAAMLHKKNSIPLSSQVLDLNTHWLRIRRRLGFLLTIVMNARFATALA